MKRTTAIIIVLSLILLAIGGVAWAENYETLQVGSYGSAVKELQKRLIELKFLSGSGADGSYGQGTEKAVMKFQKASGLPEEAAGRQKELETLLETLQQEIHAADHDQFLGTLVWSVCKGDAGSGKAL